MHDVFVSYAEDDQEVAGVISAALEQSGYGTWTYQKDALPGVSYLCQTSKAIESCPVFLLIISPSSSTSLQVVVEVERAREAGKCLVPILCNLTYKQFCAERGALRSALGDAMTITMPKDGITTLLPRLLAALKQLGVRPSVAARTKSAKTEICTPRTDTKDAPDIFISYRRETDAQTARLIRAELQRRGFRVFLDVDDLRPGYFDEALLERIQEAPHFIAILSPGCLDRCVNLNDWFRREIACALAKKKQIIPVLMPGFTFPPEGDLPRELKPIQVHHGVRYSHDFFDAMMEKIVDYLGKPPTA